MRSLMCFHPQGIPRYNKQDIGLTGKKYQEKMRLYQPGLISMVARQCKSHIPAIMKVSGQPLQGRVSKHPKFYQNQPSEILNQL